MAKAVRSTLLITALLFAACSGGDAPVVQRRKPPTSRSLLAVLPITAPFDNVGRPGVPQAVAYADGLLIMAGPEPEIFPPPALPNLVTFSLGSEQVDRMRNALTELIASQILSEIVNSADFASLASEGGRYQAGALAIYVRVAMPADLGSEGIEPNRVPWPAGAVSPEAVGAEGSFGPYGRCGVVAADELTPFLPSIGMANSISIWEFGTGLYRVGLRPMYPREKMCPGLDLPLPVPQKILPEGRIGESATG